MSQHTATFTFYARQGALGVDTPRLSETVTVAWDGLTIPRADGKGDKPTPLSYDQTVRRALFALCNDQLFSNGSIVSEAFHDRAGNLVWGWTALEGTLAHA